MQTPATGELDLGKRDRDLVSVTADRLALASHERYVVKIRGDDPMIRNLTAAEVASQILEYLRRILSRLSWWLNVT